MPREIGTIWKEGRWWKTQMAAGILTSRTLKQAKVFAEWAEERVAFCSWWNSGEPG